jgi:allantoate deiminase
MSVRQAESERFSKQADEILARCDLVAQFSQEPGRITRTFLCEPMRRLLGEVAGWMERAGMRVRLDAAGNLIGRYDGLDPTERALAIGSHLDTVPNAGKYDGVLGILMGIAAVESLGGRRLPFAIDVIAFSEEEGVRFGVPFLGSLAVAGRFDRRLIERIDVDGTTMESAFRQFDLDPDRIDEAAYPQGAIRGYVEVHIEQGPVLETLDAPAGIVEAIAGQSRLWAEVRGRAGHAGTVPMEGRRDALAAASEVVLEVERLGRATPGLRATVGAITLEPGASNVIAGRAQFSIDVRHQDDEVRSAAVAAIAAHARATALLRGLEFAVLRQEHHPAVCADIMQTSLLAKAMTAAGLEPHRLVSGAGHDAAIIAAIAPMAMLFVRSPGGISHHPDESVLPKDVAIALDVLVHYLDIVAERARSTPVSTVPVSSLGVS